jgi:trimethylamine--corrinoid protein Co-methyltransferase
MLNPEALGYFKGAGCKVVEETVFFDEDMVMEMVGKAPSKYTITPRNPERAIEFGGNSLVFGNVSSPPNYWDLETGKKSGDFKSFSD